MIKTALVSVVIALASVHAMAQDQQVPMKFKTDYTPKASDPRPTLQFSAPGGGVVAPAAQPDKYDAVPEDQPFKTYLGYPKHRVGPVVSPTAISAEWDYSGKQFSWKTNTVAYGIFYDFIATPQWTFNFEYQHYTASVDAAIAAPFSVVASEAEFDDYKVSGTNCFYISPSNFYRRWCAGFVVGNDSYPVLDFISGTELVMSKVDDIVVGVNIAFHTPFSQAIISKWQLGYDYGTGIGNSGSLVSKSNGSYYGRGTIDYQINKNHGVVAGLEARARDAKLEGTIGSIKDVWVTKSLVASGRIAYAYTF